MQDALASARGKLARSAWLLYTSYMGLDQFHGVQQSDPKIMGGTRVFAGTRVPLQNLVDALEGGDSIAELLDGFQL